MSRSHGQLFCCLLNFEYLDNTCHFVACMNTMIISVLVQPTTVQWYRLPFYSMEQQQQQHHAKFNPSINNTNTKRIEITIIVVVQPSRLGTPYDIVVAFQQSRTYSIEQH
jgi:hypothetical protein